MSRRLCRTPDDAFAAGWNEPCDHGTAPDRCDACSPTEAEIAKLVVLLSHLATSALPSAGRAAA